jgi:hypothetical protein
VGSTYLEEYNARYDLDSRDWYDGERRTDDSGDDSCHAAEEQAGKACWKSLGKLFESINACEVSETWQTASIAPVLLQLVLSRRAK